MRSGKNGAHSFMRVGAASAPVRPNEQAESRTGGGT